MMDGRFLSSKYSCPDHRFFIGRKPESVANAFRSEVVNGSGWGKGFHPMTRKVRRSFISGAENQKPTT
jgi:hypothetical protein